MAKIRVRSAAVTAPAVMALALTLSACSGDDGGAAAPQTANEPESTGPEQIEVAAEGDGPIGLTAPSAGGGSESESISGRFIVGPGGCFSFQDQGQPELLVFPEDTEFVVSGDRPSVTTETLGTVHVGEPIEAEALAVPMDETGGIPEQCAQGAAETVRVVQG